MPGSSWAGQQGCLQECGCGGVEGWTGLCDAGPWVLWGVCMCVSTGLAPQTPLPLPTLPRLTTSLLPSANTCLKLLHRTALLPSTLAGSLPPGLASALLKCRGVGHPQTVPLRSSPRPH